METVGLTRHLLFCVVCVFSISLEDQQLLRYKTRFIGRYTQKYSYAPLQLHFIEILLYTLN